MEKLPLAPRELGDILESAAAAAPRAFEAPPGVPGLIEFGVSCKTEAALAQQDALQRLLSNSAAKAQQALLLAASEIRRRLVLQPSADVDGLWREEVMQGPARLAPAEDLGREYEDVRREGIEARRREAEAIARKAEEQRKQEELEKKLREEKEELERNMRAEQELKQKQAREERELNEKLQRDDMTFIPHSELRIRNLFKGLKGRMAG
eukprot:tig00000133_g7677.t1